LTATQCIEKCIIGVWSSGDLLAGARQVTRTMPSPRRWMGNQLQDSQRNSIRTNEPSHMLQRGGTP